MHETGRNTNLPQISNITCLSLALFYDCHSNIRETIFFHLHHLPGRHFDVTCEVSKILNYAGIIVWYNDDISRVNTRRRDPRLTIQYNFFHVINYVTLPHDWHIHVYFIFISPVQRLVTAATDLKEFLLFEQRPFVRERYVFWNRKNNWTRFVWKGVVW